MLPSKFRIYNEYFAIIFGLSFLFVIIHSCWMLWYRSWTVFGYDYGFYRRYLIEPFTSIPHASVPGLDHTVLLPRIILDGFRLLGFPTDFTLVLTYWFVIVFFLVMFGLWVGQVLSKKVAIWSVVVVLLSPLYLFVYWSFLLKNILALGLFFGILFAIRKGNVPLTILFSVLLPVTHQSTTILAGLILFGFAVLQFWYRAGWRLPLLSWALILVLYLIYHPAVVSKVASPPVAAFLSDVQSFVYLVPVFLLSIVTIRRQRLIFWADKKDLLVIIFIVSFFIILGLPYHERVYPLLLLSLAPVVGYLFSILTKRWLLVCILVMTMWNITYSSKIVVQHSISEEVKASGVVDLTADDSLLSPNNIAPWLHGYTMARVYAPGFFKDPFRPEDWEYFWSQSNQRYNEDFLRSFPSPLYIYAPDGQERFLPSVNCRDQVSSVLYRYTCYE